MLIGLIKTIIKILIGLFILVFIAEFLGNFSLFEKTSVFEWYSEMKEKAIEFSPSILEPVFSTVGNWADCCYDKLLDFFSKQEAGIPEGLEIK